MKLSRIVLFIAVSAVVAFTGCGKSNDPVLAEVGDREILVSDFLASFEKLKPQERPALSTLEERKGFLNDLVNKELMEIAAFEKYPDPTARLNSRLVRFTMDNLSARAKTALIREKISVTTEMKDRFYKNMSEERHLKAMLIPDVDASRSVGKKLARGGDFSKLARDYSVDWPGQGEEHGDVGWVEPGMFPYPVDVAVWDAEVGSVVGPIELARGNYIVQVLDKRPKEVPETREELDALLSELILEKLYLDRTKFVQDSLRTAVKTYYPAEGKALLMMKYRYEIPEDQRDNPYALLDAHRVMPSFTAEEDSMVVIEFDGIPDWNANFFKNKLSWYPNGIWPTGKDEAELIELLDIMVRDYLYLEAAENLGLNNDEFRELVNNKMKEMRVNYFYYQDLRPQFEPDSAAVIEFFEANRERYRAPESYKISFFGSGNRELVETIAQRWREGASFRELADEHAHLAESELVRIGETEWLYDGQDPLRDDLIGPLKDGGVSDVVFRADVAMVVRLISRRPSRLMTYAEIRQAVEEDAMTVITDRRLREFLEEKREAHRVTIHEDALESMVLPTVGEVVVGAAG